MDPTSLSLVEAGCLEFRILIFMRLAKIKNIILDMLFPPLCINCQKTLINTDDRAGQRGYKQFLCDDCYNLIQLNTALFCPICRARLADNKKICHRDAPYLLAAAGNYDDPVLKNLIHYFKYRSFEKLAPILGEIMIQYLKKSQLINHSTNSLINYIVVPVPLHRRRERQRGFNQSQLLAEQLGYFFNLKISNALKRVKNTEPQAKSKNNESRIKNIAGCFAITEPELVRNKNILLVDDVFTSGATINEAAQLLKTTGAKKIIAIVLAKA